MSLASAVLQFRCPVESSFVITQLKSPASIIAVLEEGYQVYDFGVIKGFPFLPLLCAGGGINIFTINMARKDADNPRCDGGHWMFERARPSLARTAVPHLSLPIFIWTVYLRIVFSCVRHFLQ